MLMMDFDFYELMKTGGPLMWVIFTVAFYAFSLIIWKMIILIREIQISNKDFQNLVHNPEVLAKPEVRGSTVNVLVNGLSKTGCHSKEDIVGELNIRMAFIMPLLEGQMGTIATLGSLLPMLGLLGTVLGMINVFDVVAIHGSGKPEAMAEGISQALLTTASGLIFAIPVIYMHHVLSDKLNQVTALLQQTAQHLLRQSSSMKCE